LNILKEKNCIKNLIICPASAIYQWVEEYNLWLDRPCLALTSSIKAREQYLNDFWTDGLVISYDLFKPTAHTKGLLDYITAHQPDAMIIDEAHRIKNPKSANAKAVFKTVKFPVRIALTGTPAPNKPQEIFSILHWLYPDKFKSYWGFIDTYFVKETKYGAGHTYIEIKDFKPGMDKSLQNFLNDVSTQRKRKEVMQWLPDKDYQQVKLPATKEQTKYLTELKHFFTTEDIQVQGVLDRLVRYRQICLHPGLLNLKGSSPKLDWLQNYLDDNPDKPVIVFSKFTSFLKILDKELPQEKGLIIGETPIEKRNELKLNFQCGKINLLLINIDAGKEALTLDRAEVIIFTDKYPPVGDILQAEDRFISTTEDKKDKPHTIIELMIKGTYDEQLYKLLELRKSTTDIINDYKKYLKGD
jgi:SNF2 family DNA or RNA helicase